VKNVHLWLVPAGGAQPPRDLMPGFDRSCEDLVITDTKALHGAGQKPVWSADGRRLLLHRRATPDRATSTGSRCRRVARRGWSTARAR
jgi:hypothetical protein